MLRPSAAALLALALLAAPAAAATAPSRPRVLMLQATGAAPLRAALRAFADSAAGTGPAGAIAAGEASYWLGTSEARAGGRDSAVAAFRRAVRLRGDFADVLALAATLLARGGPADVGEAGAVLGDALRNAGDAPPAARAELRACEAWRLDLAHQPDSALALLPGGAGPAPRGRGRVESFEARGEAPLERRPEWARRFARIELERGRAEAAWRTLAPVAARSRLHDAEAVALLHRAAPALGMSDSACVLALRDLAAQADSRERALAAAWGVERRTLPAADGFPLAVLLARAPRATGAPVILLASPADTLADADSLVAQLRRGGHDVALVAPRGSDGSVGRGCAGPDAWAGREDSLAATVAADLRGVAATLARRGLRRPGPWIAGGVGAAAPLAVAAARGGGVAALLLVAPDVLPVEQGPVLAAIAAGGVRTFVQVSPEEFAAGEWADAVAAGAPPGLVRVADSGEAGRGAAIFRAGPKPAQRFEAWLGERPARH